MAQAQELTYLQRPIPSASSSASSSSTSLLSSKGLSKRSVIDSAYFKDCYNIDVAQLPVIMPMKVYGDCGDFKRKWKYNEIEKFASAATAGTDGDETEISVEASGEIDGENLVTNGDFASGDTAGWTSCLLGEIDGAEVVYDEEIGANALHMSKTTINISAATVGTLWTTEVGKTYRLSFDVKFNSKVANHPEKRGVTQYVVKNFDDDTITSVDVDGDCDMLIDFVDYGTTLNVGDWQHIETTFIAETDTVYFQMRRTGAFYLANVMLREVREIIINYFGLVDRNGDGSMLPDEAIRLKNSRSLYITSGSAFTIPDSDKEIIKYDDDNTNQDYEDKYDGYYEFLTQTDDGSTFNLYFIKGDFVASVTINYLNGDGTALKTSRVVVGLIGANDGSASYTVEDDDKEMFAVGTDYYGYDSERTTADSVVLTDGENVINLYFKEVGFATSVTINYLNGDGTALKTSRVVVGLIGMNDGSASYTVEDDDKEIIEYDDGYYIYDDDNELNVGSVTLTDGENVINLYFKVTDGDEVKGDIPVGECPSLGTLGKYLLVGSYIRPSDILDVDGWEAWLKYIQRDTYTVSYKVDGKQHWTGRLTSFSPHLGVTEDGAELDDSDELSSWYCIVVVDTQTGTAYMTLPPVSGTAFEGGTEGSMYDFMNSETRLGKKRLCAFMYHESSDTAYSLGTYVPTVLAVNSTQDDDYEGLYKQSVNYRQDDGSRNDDSDSGLVAWGTTSGRCVRAYKNGLKEFSSLFHAMSLPLSDIVAGDNEFRGFLMQECAPYVHYDAHQPSEQINSVSGDDLGEIAKYESAMKFVDGAVPASAVIVANSRLYSLYESGVYVSGYNNYADFSTKFTDEVSSSEPWSSLSAGDISTAGSFLAILPYKSKLVCFKRNSTMEIRGTSAPFTLCASSSVGAVSETAAALGGGYLMFAGRDNVYMYTGAEPEAIGDELCLSRVTEAELASEGEYLYCRLSDESGTDGYVMSLQNGCWGRIDLPSVMEFARIDDKIYCVYKTRNENGYIEDQYGNRTYDEEYRLGLLGENHPEKWSFETKYFSGGTYDDLLVEGINLLYDLDKGASLKVSIRYYPDDDYTVVWKKKASTKIEKEKTKIKFSSVRCGGWQIKVEGSYYGVIYAMDAVGRVKQ